MSPEIFFSQNIYYLQIYEGYAQIGMKIEAISSCELP